MNMKQLQFYRWAALLLLVIPLVFSSCKKSEEAEVIAGFTYQADPVNFLKITFTNTSQNFATVAWDFGDGATSTEVNPSHTFAAAGEYTVKITATSDGGNSDIYTEKITLTDPNEMLTALVGADSKTWKLLRDPSTGRYPVECGPEDHSTIWWAMGNGNDAIAERPCLLNDEWTFFRNGNMTFNANGDYWAEGTYFVPDNICASTSDPMVNGDGTDLSAWASTDHTYSLYTGSTPKITAKGLGAFIGYIKLGNGSETKVPLDSVQYNIVKLTDGTVDTLIIEGVYRWDPATPGGYWRHVLVHYDNPADEPPIPGNKPSVGFTLDWNGLTVTCTNTSTGATSYLWDFGDGQTSTEANPVHTYANGGIFTLSLTATNTNGSSATSTVAFVTNQEITDAILQGGSWKVRIDDYAVFVGSGMGKSDWWKVSKSMLDGTSTGADDWSCMPDDEFIFSAGGVFEYKTNGSARNDGYFGSTNGCWSDAEIAASVPSATSGTGSAFGSGVHSYTFTPATGSSRAIITLTNGSADRAAFLGFYKGYNGIASGIQGGENSRHGADPNYYYDAPNFGSPTNTYEVMGYANSGTKEYLFVTVDITADHSGGSSWSAILER